MDIFCASRVCGLLRPFWKLRRCAIGHPLCSLSSPRNSSHTSCLVSPSRTRVFLLGSCCRRPCGAVSLSPSSPSSCLTCPCGVLLRQSTVHRAAVAALLKPAELLVSGSVLTASSTERPSLLCPGPCQWVPGLSRRQVLLSSGFVALIRISLFCCCDLCPSCGLEVQMPSWRGHPPP